MKPAAILIVEDEPLIAMMLEDYLTDMGHHVVASCNTLASALEAAQGAALDLAILDVNLGSEPVWPVADLLRGRGVPFILASGGEPDGPAHLCAAPLLQKPYGDQHVRAAITGLLLEQG